MSALSNFDGGRPVIEPGKAAMLLIDYQSGLIRTIADTPMPALRTSVATLAKAATLAAIPVISTISMPQGPNGRLIPEIPRYAPHAIYVGTRGEINAWDNPDVVAAVRGAGKWQLIIGGAASVSMALPAVAAVADGYQVFAVLDASASYSRMAEEIMLCRITQAGVVPTETAAVCLELQQSWNREDAALWADLHAGARGNMRTRSVTTLRKLEHEQEQT